MQNYRYEDYSAMEKRMPCVVISDIIRTKNKLSDTANWHHNVEIQFCCEGAGFVILDGVKTEISTGDIIVVNYDTIHYTGTEDYIKYHCIIIDNDFCNSSGIHCEELGIEKIFKNKTIESAILQAVSEYKNTEDICYKAKLQYLILKILIEIRVNHAEGVFARSRDGKYFEAVKDAMRYIQGNYDSKITLDLLAKETYVDKYSLSKKFKQFTGITIVDYINNYRCNVAIRMIQNGESIYNVAQKCGFNNISFFTKTFKRHTGKLPSVYKNKHLQ